MKSCIIYLAPDCHECEEVLKYINGRNIIIETKLLSKEEWVEKEIFIFPALMKDEEIIAYGIDILKYLN